MSLLLVGDGVIYTTSRGAEVLTEAAHPLATASGRHANAERIDRSVSAGL
jgi:hypothetical protein